MAPRLVINLKAITENTRKTIDRCRGFGVEVVGVTRGVSGLPPVAKAMLEGGIRTLGDSRLNNIARMQQATIPWWISRSRRCPGGSAIVWSLNSATRP
jgi:predicted amino acid racemase